MSPGEAEAAFAAACAFTRAEEGGYSDRADDAGNWTAGRVGEGLLVGSNMGVSAPVLQAWLGERTPLDAATMRALSRSTFEAIAQTRYWTPLGADRLAAPVAVMVFDFGWNAGIGCAARLFQRVLGLAGDDVDGDIGPETAARAARPAWGLLLASLHGSAILDLQRRCGVAPDGVAGPRTLAALAAAPALWPRALATRLADAQLATYRGMQGYAVFGAGWAARTRRRLAAAVALETAVPVTPPRIADPVGP